MIWLVKTLLILAMFVLVLSCGFPSDKQVMDEFRAQNSAYQPLSANIGEGDGDATYFHIQYRKPNDDHIYEQVWLYLRHDDGEIKLHWKEAERLIK